MSDSGASMHGELRDDLAAYALGGLGPDEAAAVSQHLAGCEACRDYVRWLQPAVDLLPASVAQVEPPARLRESLMATVHAEAREADPLSAPTGPSATERSGRRRSWRGLVLRPATVLAAVAVLAVGAVVGYGLAGSGDEQPDLMTIHVKAERPADNILARIEHGDGEDAILRVERAPALDRGHFYQAWVRRDGEMQRSASFRPGDDGGYIADLNDSLDGADAVLVTEEAQRHPDEPSSALIMRAQLG